MSGHCQSHLIPGQRILVMSALPPKADIGTQPRDVRFVPKATYASDIRTTGRHLFDHHICGRE
jgi:hypothetical protein